MLKNKTQVKYYDKSKKKDIDFSASEQEFLVISKTIDDSETVSVKSSGIEGIAEARPISKIGMIQIKFSKQALKSRSVVKNTLDRISRDNTVVSVVPAFTDSEGFTRRLSSDKVVVQFNNGTSSSKISKILGDKAIAKKGVHGKWVAISLGQSETVEETIIRLNDFDEVSFAEPAFLGIDDREGTALRWNHKLVEVAKAWELVKGNPAIAVAVIDGLPDLMHPALKELGISKLPKEYSFCDSSEMSTHATAIASILVGKGTNLAGLAPKIRVIPLCVQLQGQFYYERAEAINFLASVQKSKRLGEGTINRIVGNCSWKTDGDISIIRKAFQNAMESGVIFVTSSGNTNDNGPHYPSDYASEFDSMISVAAVSQKGTRAEYSNYSKSVTISAPGGAGLPLDSDDIYCADIESSYMFGAGTSFAAPHVAAAIALMLSVNDKLTAAQIRSILKNSSTPLLTNDSSIKSSMGYGILNIGNAITAMKKDIKDVSPNDDDKKDPVDPDPDVPPHDPDDPDTPVINEDDDTLENKVEAVMTCLRKEILDLVDKSGGNALSIHAEYSGNSFTIETQL